MLSVCGRVGEVLGLVLGVTIASTAQTKPPTITRIANAATYELPETAVPRQALFTIFGQDLAGETRSASPPLPLELAGVRVSMDGAPAPLLYVSPTQINGQVPLLAWSFHREVSVTTRSGTAKVTLDEAPPGGIGPRVFLRQGGSCGRAFIFNVLEDGSWQPNSPESGAPPSSWITILANGAGINYDVKDGQAAPPGRDAENNPGSRAVRFNRTYNPDDWPYDYSFNGKLAGAVGVDQINARVPPDLPEGCAVPLRLDGGGSFGYGQLSQAVPVTISRTKGTCTDPPPGSSGVIRLERVLTSGFEPSEDKNVITLEFMRARGRTLQDEGDPNYILRRTVTKIGTSSTLAKDFFEKLEGPSCPGFEAYRGELLDPGTIIVGREDGGPEVVLAPRQNQNGQWGYSASLPDDLLREGAIRIRGLGGADVGPFETSIEFPPFRFLTDLSPGAQFPFLNVHVEWAGGNADDTIRASRGEFDSPVKTSQVLLRVGDGRCSLPSLFIPGYDEPKFRPGDPIGEINFVIESAEPGTTTFQAAGLTLGGRVERRMIYRFKGLVAK